jgi:ubiquinone/menaquinone biosynthesis C-methylase UbiE
MLRSLFDAVADSYDQVGVDFFQPIAAGLVAELDPRPGERALDLGCGRGAALLPIARAVGPTGAAVGGDLSPVMVAEATALAAEEGLGQVEVLVVDAQEPEPAGLGTEPYDLLSASLVLFFLPDPGGAVARWRELTRPGGRVGVSTFGPPDPTWRRIDALFEPYLPPQLLDARTTGIAGPFESNAGVEGLFTAAGWSDARSTETSVPVRFEGPDHWYRFTMSTGQRGFWGLTPEDKRAGIREAATRIIEEAADPDGSVTFTQGVRYTLARNP